ncbi:MAG: molybdate ABC transporter substrate-binding protein [bacterium]|nr:molybdate ABC transporter substrate-binding protein [bacterium]
MSGNRNLILGFIVLLSAVITGCSQKENEPLRAAVSANFVTTFRELAVMYEEQTGQKVVDSAGSTGTLYAQICNGAPFDIFLAADCRRPELLEAGGHAIPESRFTYAEGKLVLWTSNQNPEIEKWQDMLIESETLISMGNPELAPYGKAALETLENSDMLPLLEDRLVYGTNVAQAYQFVATGNAGAGFVAQSLDDQTVGSTWVIPDNLYTPIPQQAVQISSDIRAKNFLEFLRSPEAIRVIKDHGYDVPAGRTQ